MALIFSFRILIDTSDNESLKKKKHIRIKRDLILKYNSEIFNIIDILLFAVI